MDSLTLSADVMAAADELARSLEDSPLAYGCSCYGDGHDPLSGCRYGQPLLSDRQRRALERYRRLRGTNE